MEANVLPTADELRALSRCLLDLYHLDLGMPRAAFVAAVFARYGDLIPHDAALWGGGRAPGDPAVGIVSHFVHLNGIAAEDIVPVWERPSNAALRGRLAAHMAAHAGRAQIVHGATPGLEQAFEQLFGCCGIRHLLGIYLFDPELKLFNLVSLYRRGDAPFAEAERVLHELAAPHIQAVLRNHALNHLGAASGASSARAGGTAAVDAAGTVHHAHPEFVRLLREEWPGWEGPDLPAAIAHQVAASYLGRHIVVSSADAGGDFRRCYARRKHRIDELTAREREVAESFACGQTYKEVARDLGIAPNTVRNLLVSVYGKLGVSDKGKLAQVLAGQGPDRPA